MRYTMELNDATQYATVYDENEKPVATLIRRHALDPKDSPRWKLFATDGKLLRSFYLPTSYDMLARKVSRLLEKLGEGVN